MCSHAENLTQVASIFVMFSPPRSSVAGWPALGKWPRAHRSGRGCWIRLAIGARKHHHWECLCGRRGHGAMHFGLASPGPAASRRSRFDLGDGGEVGGALHFGSVLNVFTLCVLRTFFFRSLGRAMCVIVSPLKTYPVGGGLSQAAPRQSFGWVSLIFANKLLPKHLSKRPSQSSPPVVDGVSHKEVRINVGVAGDFQGHPARFLGRFSQYVVSNSVDSFPYELLPRQFAEPVALIALSLTYQFQQHCFVLCSSTRQPSWPAFLGSFPNLLSSHKFVSSEIEFPRSFLVSEWCFEVV